VSPALVPKRLSPPLVPLMIGIVASFL